MSVNKRGLSFLLLLAMAFSIGLLALPLRTVDAKQFPHSQLVAASSAVAKSAKIEAATNNGSPFVARNSKWPNSSLLTSLFLPQLSGSSIMMSNVVGPRTVRVVSTTLAAGQSGTVSIELDSQGDENALGFSLNFDQTKLSYVSAVMGTDAAGASMNVNPSATASGRLGLALALGAGATFSSGTRQLVTVTFTVAASGNGSTTISFGDSPIGREIVNVAAAELVAAYSSGTINLTPLPAPVPTLTSLSPVAATTGGPSFNLTVGGTGFLSGSVVRFNGSARPTTFISSTQMTAQIDSADIQAAGSFPITIFTPAPGGGTSNALNLAVNNVTLTSLSPASVTTGGPAFTLTVNGNGFVSTSVVRINNTDRATTFVNNTQLTAQIPATDIQAGGLLPITVSTTTGAGTSNALNLAVNNATLTSLSPSSATTGGPAFTLTANGSGFVSTSVVRFNGSDRATTFVDGSQLTAQISATDIQTGGSFPITVSTTSGAGTSNAINFSVGNPVPTISTLSPSATVAGGPALTLTVNGSNFVSGAVVRWNGNSRTTSLINSTQLTAQVTAADISAAGTASITVFNPAPVGGASNAVSFTINTNPAFRNVRVVGATFQAGQNNSISVELDAQGDENALGFSLNFDAAKMSFVSAVNGSGAGAATLNVNTLQLANGQLGLGIGLSAGQTFTAGTRQLAVITFNVPVGSSGSTVISFGNSPVVREVSDPGANVLGATYTPATVSINHPAPTLSNISPTSAVAGGAGFTLTLNGNNFVSESVVRFSGSDRPTTFVSATQLTAQISAADIANLGSFPVTVFTLAPGGGTSNSSNLTVSPVPVPSIINVAPATVTAGGPDFTLTVDGANFVNGSVVRFNGNNRATTFVSSSQLTATISASDIVNTGLFPITVFNPAPGGGTSNAVNLAVNNQALTSISPSAITAGSPEFTLTAIGGGFLSTSVVRFNGSDRPTTFVNNTQLTAQISAADIQASGLFPITVSSTTGAGTSNAVNLTVNNPAPTLGSVSPSSTLAGGPAFTLTVNGTNFSGSSVVRFNGSNRSTSFVSSTQLTAQITAADISAIGSPSVTVFNPTPGGGTSNALSFTINSNPAFRFIRVLGGTFQAGQNNSLSVELDAQGDENALGFSLNFDKDKMSFVSAVMGSGATGATLNVNDLNVASGQLGIALSKSAGDVFPAGTRQLVVVTFNVSVAASGSSLISFGDVPISREVVSPGAALLGATYTSGLVSFNHPAPTLSNISPASAEAGGAGFTLTVNGNNFVSESVVKFNGNNRPTTFVNATQLTVQISAADITNSGAFPVTVLTPAPGGGISSALSFAVNNPLPVITSLAPGSAVAGEAGFSLTVNGTSFVNGAKVRFNGSDRPTTFVSATQLTAQITAADIQTGGPASVTVFNPSPGGGQSVPASFTINNPLPTLNAVSPTSAVVGGAGFTLTVNGGHFVNGAVVKWNGSDRVTNFVSNSQLTAQITAADIQSIGTFSITVSNPEPGGGLSGAVALPVTNPPPIISSISPSGVLAGAAGFTLTVNGSSFVSGAVVKLNGSGRTTAFVNSTQLSAQIDAADVAAAGLVPVTVENPAPGGGTSSPINLTVDNPMPAIASLSPSSVLAGGAAFTLTVDGSNFVNGSIVRLNGSNRPTVFVSATQLTAQITAADIQSGATLPVTVFNPAPGGGASSPASLTINNPAPSLSSLSPASGLAGSGPVTLTLNGGNFINGSVVQFNGASRSTTFVNSTQLSAQLTAADLQAAGNPSIIVVNPGPGGGLSNSIEFPISNPVPVISALSPDSVLANGPALTITVNGTNFVNGSKVSLNGNERTTSFVSSTQLTAQILVTDVQSAGTFPITVANPSPGGGVSNPLNFTVNNRIPVIANIGTASAVTGDPAFTLTVNGSNFIEGSVVRFEGNDRLTAFINDTQLTAQITAADLATAGTFHISVFNPAPGGGQSNLVNFKVVGPNPVPTISSLSPASISVGGPVSAITVNGTNYVDGSVVRFNGSDRITTLVSSTQLTAQVTAADIQSTGTLQVTVFNPTPGGGISNPADLAVNNPLPVIANLSPASAVAGEGAFTLTVNGAGFINGSVVKWNGTNRVTSFVSTAQLTAQITAADIQAVGSATLTVVNPAPGGGTSDGVNFAIALETAKVQFSSANYELDENQNSIEITVVRTGDMSSAITVDFATDDNGAFIPCGSPTGGADQRCDYATAGGTLSFAPGEASKKFTLLNTDDVYVEGNETFTLTLSNPAIAPGSPGGPLNNNAGVALGSPARASLMILDNDMAPPTNNPIDVAQYFVNQHYIDFLNRVPDSGGLGYWSNQIAQCGTDLKCIQKRRVGVSAAFFVELEFQKTGYVVYRLYKASYGSKPTYPQFMPDRSQLVDGPQLQASTIALVNRFVARPEFKAAYPDSMTPAEFIDKLYNTAGLMNNAAERQQQIDALTSGNKTRAKVLLDVIEIPEFKQREYDPAFVLMQYFGYLRRNPDEGGYAFWLDVLNSRVPGNYQAMVCAFITSKEYQERFSSVVTHTNQECGP
jgi:hypothetical protein